jgi:hypothetical protein
MINNANVDQNVTTLSNVLDVTVSSIFSLWMNNDNRTVSTETKPSTPIDLNAQTPNRDGGLFETCHCGIPLQIVLNSMGLSMQDMKLVADQGNTLLNSVMEVVCRMVKVFQKICKEQHIILNLLQIKDLILHNTYMEAVCRKVKVFQQI